ncbi:hypothetical protein HNR46_002027 [Haloferula luteola]|uniref:Choice-of-anchor I domain-containing protein n=1 Tax=Haloferula luteola TaxID=595692 RepID=A0A840VAS8_9BACT|nr:choice-of-anchor I family protein [Haloferula luteola]MBB5351788.1 hypothetical protein [Haloferula luteola]
MNRLILPLILPSLVAGAYAELSLEPLGTARNGDPASLFDASAAEIVKFDSATNQMYVVNGSADALDIFDVSTPTAPSLVRSVDLSELGNPNSVDVFSRGHRTRVAVAVGAPSKADRGHVVFLNGEGDLLDTVEVGYLPDMLTFNENGTMVVVANEGEPTDDYAVDPEGSISIIRIRGNRYHHREITFGGLTADDVEGVRISGPEGTTIAQDLEPEYVAISGQHAFVTCQENNAVIKINLTERRIAAVLPLGTIDHSKLGHALDVSDKDDAIRIANWPIQGLFMPDGIAAYRARDGRRTQTYFVTANEGDAREWGDYTDEARIKSLNLDPSAFPLAETLQLDAHLGRLAAITTEGDIDGDGDYDELYSFGTRSFSIFDENGTLVFDSGDLLETYIATHYPEDFNGAHDESDSFDSRSDAKGPEPETVTLGEIDGHTYAFIALERFSGIAVFDITNPHSVTMSGFGLNRDFSVSFDEDHLENFGAAGDLGPEGLDFVSAKDSPTGQPLLIVANEVSGTTTLYQISVTE